MKAAAAAAFRALRRPLTSSSNLQFRTNTTTNSNFLLLHRFYAAEPHQDDAHSSESDSGAVFDSTHFELPGGILGSETTAREPTWDEKYRNKAKDRIFKEGSVVEVEKNDELIKRDRANALLARTLLDVAVMSDDEDHEQVKEEDQKSLAVGIIGPPNAGKSQLTNIMAGTKVSGVSRKTNTTTHEVLGVMTKGNTQVCFFDTPGLMLTKYGYPHKDMKVRVESAWSAVELYDVLLVIFDVHRHLTSMDSRVVRLIRRMGEQVHPTQKRVLCMNKVDLVTKKKELLKAAEEFKDLPGYERYFMISGLKGSGVKDLTQYLMEQAVKRPWDEDSLTMSEEVMKNISLEVVRERLLDHIHQEIPYSIEHRLMDWKEMRDGSLLIEQHLITPKLGQRKILVGMNGSKIGRIGSEATEELTKILNRRLRLVLVVKVKKT